MNGSIVSQWRRIQTLKGKAGMDAAFGRSTGFSHPVRNKISTTDSGFPSGRMRLGRDVCGLFQSGETETEEESAMRQSIATLVLLLGTAAFATLPGDAHAQAFNVNKFTCSATTFGVDIDVSGLGNTDICVVGTATIGLNCACAGGGGNCTSDAKKATISSTVSTSQEVESKNGRAIATVTVPFTTSDSQCTTGTNPLTCPSGQTARLVKFAASEEFQLCTSNGASPCGCAQELDAITCTSSGTPFPGKRNSCSALFPS